MELEVSDYYYLWFASQSFMTPIQYMNATMFSFEARDACEFIWSWLFELQEKYIFVPMSSPYYFNFDSAIFLGFSTDW